MKRLVFILLFLPPLLLCSQANQDSKQDSLRKVADQYMKEQQYEKAANLYKELGEKIDADYKEISTHKVKDLRNTYSIDELQLANNQQQNHLLLLALIVLPCLIIITIFGFLYLKRKAKKLMLSKRKLQKAEKAVENSIRNKSLFISNMSHEIHTPLNALSGFSTILTDANIDISTRQQCNEIIQQNSDLLLKLIDDVVDLSSLEIGKMQFLFANNNAVAICRNVVDTVEKIKQTSASVLFQTSLENLEIYTDEARLQQLLINLLINATKFTTEGSITLSLEKQPEGVALFAVSDTGCGIAPEKQGAIFNRFEKLNENAQGSGLGLSICQLIVERFGGKIWIDPEYKNGSRFLFTHPIVSTSRKEVSE